MSSKSMKKIIQMMESQGTTLDLSDGADFEANRKAMDDANKMMPLEPGVTCSKEIFEGVPVEMLSPESPNDGIILDIHGGAFIYGSLETCRSYAAALAKESNMRVYTVDYRLAPEHPFPEGVEDCFNVYQKICEKYQNHSIAVVGESAGATLALSVGLMAKDRGIKMPSCVVAFSPCASFADDFPGRKNNISTELIIPAGTIEKMKKLYMAQGDLKNPYASPIYGDFSGYPPVKLVADGGEVLVDDTRELEKKLRLAGVDVDCRIYEETFHTFANLAHLTEESSKELTDTAKFIFQNM